MSNNSIPFFLVILFVCVLFSPTIVTLSKSKIAESMLFTTSEEGEESNENNIELEVLISTLKKYTSDFSCSNKRNGLTYFNKIYTDPYICCISPPPDLI